MEEIMLLATILVPVITGALQVVKNTVNLPKTFMPIVAVILGVLIGILASPIAPFTELAIELRIWVGAVAGLAAVGLFELSKKHEGTTKAPVQKK